MKKTLSPRERLIFWICGFMIAVFVLYNFGWRMFQDGVDGIEGQISARTAKLKKARQSLVEAESYQQRHQDYQKSLGQQGTDEAVASQLLSEIEQVSVQTGLKVSDLKPLRIREDKFYRTFPVSVTVDGSFVTTLEFIDVLQNDPHRFDVLDLRMDQAQRRGEEIKTRLIMGKIFFKEPSAKDEKKSK
jgi:Tfp pilus assembly protein PilO